LGGLSIAGLSQPISELGAAQVENLELSPSQNNVKIDFFGLDFRPGETLRYQYKLEGADHDWSLPSEQRTVTYANLQPGSYRFLVRAVNTDGDVSQQPATIGFKILPPVWRRWWFIALLALTFGTVAFILIRTRAEKRKAATLAREQRLRDLERVRKHIATDLHDDVGSSLTQISILSEVAIQQLETTNGSASQLLTEIAGSSRELVDTMSDIVWAVNPQKDRFEDLIQRMRRFASDTLEARNIELCFDAPENENFAIGANERRELFLIFKECVNNIVKHSGCTRVAVEVKRSASGLELRVSDNGRGFDTARESEGHGLMSMSERARLLGGALRLESSDGTGTTLTLKVPMLFQDQARTALN
jgi:signal transduction histidine kinase